MSNDRCCRNNNSSINLLIEGLALTQSAVVSLIDTYSEFLKHAPKMIDYWDNIFLEPWTRTTRGKQKR